MGLFKNLIRGVNDIKAPTFNRGLRQPIRNINFPPIRRMPMPQPMPVVPPSPLVPPRTIGDINRLIPSLDGLPPTIAPPPTNVPGAPIPSSGRGGLKGAFDNFQKFIAQNPDKTRQGGGILGGVDLTGESLRNALPPVVGGPPLDTSLIPEREILQRPIIPPKRNDFMSIERIDKPINELIPRMPNEASIPFVPPVPAPLQRQPQPNLATGIIDPVSQPIQQLPQGPQPIPQVPNPFEKPIMPPKRDDFMSIDRIGNYDLERQNRGIVANPAPVPVTSPVIPQQPTFTPISERTDIYGAGKDYDPANLPEGYTFDQSQVPGKVMTTVMPQPGFVYAYGPDGDRISVPSGAPGAEAQREQGAARDQAFRDFQKTNPGEAFGVTPPSPPISTPVPEPVTTPAPVTPPEPVTPPASTTVAANQPAPAPVVEPTTTDDPVVVEPPVEPAATTTTTNAGQAVNNPFAASVTQRQTTLDPVTQQLLFGLDGQGGFIPGAMRAAEKTFYDDQGNPIVIDEQVAGFSPDQLAAMQMQRQSVGQQDPYLGTAADAYGAGTQALEEGLQRGRTAAIGSLAATRGGLGSLRQGLGESADILRGTVGGYDPSMTERFYDPYEDRVVQQTIQDVMEQGAKSDIGARAGDIARGGESAFGSRARLGASERQRAIGRGLAEALGGIRSQGFRQAQQTGLGEFARQKAAERAASSGLAGLAGQGFTGQQALAGALSGLGQTEQNIGQQRYSGQFGLGSSLQGLGAQAAGASASDIAALYGMGAQQQGQTQQMLDAQRRNLQQRQMTPLLQYQALQPFVSMAPAGQFQTDTQFVPAPSPVQAGMGVGLSAFGALGQLYGGKD